MNSVILLLCRRHHLSAIGFSIGNINYLSVVQLSLEFGNALITLRPTGTLPDV
jgi:hypothetical protein